MSTLKVNTIQNTSAAHSSTPEEIAKGRAKAWGNIAGTGTVAFRNSYNCSSVTDNGTGDYTINFDTDFSDDGYSFVGTAENYEGNNDDSYCGLSVYHGSYAVGSIRIRISRWRWDQYTFPDTPNVSFAAFL